MIGAGNRKWHVVLYSNAADRKQYLTESFRDRLPGCKIGKSCIDVPDKITVADDVLVDLTRQSVAYFRSEFEKPRAPKALQLWE